jgi:acyl dehydratase
MEMVNDKMTKYWDDFIIGESYFSTKRVISGEDVDHFAALSEDFNPLHVDEEYAKQTLYGQRIAHGMLVLSKVTGLHYGLGIFKGSSLGVLEVNWKFIRPVYLGDTIQFEAIVIGKKPTSKINRGILERHILVRNQKNEIVQQGNFINLIRRRVISASET